MTPETRAALEAGLGHRFIRPDHLAVALTHRSFGVDTPNNEKLEFLGDAVLALAMSDLLMTRFPDASEGELSKIRASLVNADVLARKARELDVGSGLRFGKGEEKSGGREKVSILASAYEALLGAVYADAAAHPAAGGRGEETRFRSGGTNEHKAGQHCPAGDILLFQDHRGAALPQGAHSD